MKKLLLTGVSFALALVAHSKVVINEFSYNDTSGDNISFIELYNSGSEPVSLNGWRIVLGARASDNPELIDVNFTFPPEATIAADGYLLLGTNPSESAIINANFTIHYMLSADKVLRNYKNFITLYNASDAVADSVVYARGQINGAQVLPAGHGEPPSDGISNSVGGGIRDYLITGQANNANGGLLTTTNDPSFYNTTLTYQRNPDPLYLDTDDNDLDFLLANATPGTRNFSNNIIEASALDSEIVFNFDETGGTVEKRLGGTYFDMHNQDPATAPSLGTGNRSANTQAIPPSPQGGNVGIHWNHLQDADVMGNGVQGVLSIKEPIKDIEVETYVYVGPALKDEPLVLPNENDPTSETHIWEGGSFVIARGRPDTHPIGHNRYAFYSYANGDTGIRLHYRNNIPRGSKYTVYFDQQVNGVRTIFEQFEVDNPGWYRVLLSVRGDQTMAIFGGEFGNYTAADGTFENGKRLPATPNTYYTTTITRPGNVGYNYHAFLALNNAGKKKFRPATFDKLTYRKPTVIPSSSVDSWKIY